MGWHYQAELGNEVKMHVKKNIIILFIIFVSLILLVADNFSFQKRIDPVDVHYRNGRVTQEDKQFMKFIYNSMIFFGGIPYPEAAKILKHYIYGDGSDLYIKSDYFKRSVFIKQQIARYKDKPVGPITLRIGTDPRVAYAVNGFYLKRDQDRYFIYQRIIFDTVESGKNVFTTFTFFNQTVAIPDYLIRIFESDGGCNPFTVYIYWDI